MFDISVKEQGVLYNIEDVALHPNYKGEAYDDVAVIRLKPSESKTFFFILVIIVFI